MIAPAALDASTLGLGDLQILAEKSAESIKEEASQLATLGAEGTALVKKANCLVPEYKRIDRKANQLVRLNRQRGELPLDSVWYGPQAEKAESLRLEIVKQKQALLDLIVETKEQFSKLRKRLRGRASHRRERAAEKAKHQAKAQETLATVARKLHGGGKDASPVGTPPAPAAGKANGVPRGEAEDRIEALQKELGKGGHKYAVTFGPFTFTSPANAPDTPTNLSGAASYVDFCKGTNQPRSEWVGVEAWVNAPEGSTVAERDAAYYAAVNKESGAMPAITTYPEFKAKILDEIAANLDLPADFAAPPASGDGSLYKATYIATRHSHVDRLAAKVAEAAAGVEEARKLHEAALLQRQEALAAAVKFDLSQHAYEWAVKARENHEGCLELLSIRVERHWEAVIEWKKAVLAEPRDA